VTDTLIGALLNQIESGSKAAAPALLAFKAMAEALPGIRQPEVIAALNRMCKHDDETLRKQAREARLLMWIPQPDERVRVNGYPGRVHGLRDNQIQATVEIDDGHRLMVDDVYIWEITPRTKTR